MTVVLSNYTKGNRDNNKPVLYTKSLTVQIYLADIALIFNNCSPLPLVRQIIFLIECITLILSGPGVSRDWKESYRKRKLAS